LGFPLKAPVKCSVEHNIVRLHLVGSDVGDSSRWPNEPCTSLIYYKGRVDPGIDRGAVTHQSMRERCTAIVAKWAKQGAARLQAGRWQRTSSDVGEIVGTDNRRSYPVSDHAEIVLGRAKVIGVVRKQRILQVNVRARIVVVVYESKPGSKIPPTRLADMGGVECYRAVDQLCGLGRRIDAADTASLRDI